MTLCKDLVVVLLDGSASVAWTQVRSEVRGREGLTVGLHFVPDDGAEPMAASCHYRHDAVEDTAAILADPMSAYATSPYRVTFVGREIRNPVLAQAIKEAMLRQGRVILDRVRQGIDQAADEVQRRLDDSSR